MNILKISVILSWVWLVACNESRADYSGAWQRAIADNELGIEGVESLILTPDSMLEIVNHLSMVYADSDFNYRTEFVTVIKGQWSVESNRIVATLDTSTYTFDTIVGKTLLLPIKANVVADSKNILSMMGDELLDNLKGFYYSAYANSDQLVVNSPMVINDSILTGVCGQSQISWLRNDTQE